MWKQKHFHQSRCGLGHLILSVSILVIRTNAHQTYRTLIRTCKYARRSSVSRASFVEPTEENQAAATTIQSMVRERRVHAELMAQEEAAKSIQRAFRKRQANKVHGKKGHAAKVQPNSDGV